MSENGSNNNNMRAETIIHSQRVRITAVVSRNVVHSICSRCVGYDLHGSGNLRGGRLMQASVLINVRAK